MYLTNGIKDDVDGVLFVQSFGIQPVLPVAAARRTFFARLLAGFVLGNLFPGYTATTSSSRCAHLITLNWSL